MWRAANVGFRSPVAAEPGNEKPDAIHLSDQTGKSVVPEYDGSNGLRFHDGLRKTVSSLTVRMSLNGGENAVVLQPGATDIPTRAAAEELDALPHGGETRPRAATARSV